MMRVIVFRRINLKYWPIRIRKRPSAYSLAHHRNGNPGPLSALIIIVTPRSFNHANRTRLVGVGRRRESLINVQITPIRANGNVIGQAEARLKSRTITMTALAISRKQGQRTITSQREDLVPAACPRLRSGTSARLVAWPSGVILITRPPLKLAT